MRSLAFTLVVLLLAPVAAQQAVAQAWLTVSGADGSFRLDMPIPFDVPPADIEPDGTVVLAYVHETAEVALRFEVVESPMRLSESMDRLLLISRAEIGARILQSRVQVAGQRTYRLTATFPPEFEGDPMIHRFLASMRLQD
jgi:hypothetical protein